MPLAEAWSTGWQHASASQQGLRNSSNRQALLSSREEPARHGEFAIVRKKSAGRVPVTGEPSSSPSLGSTADEL